MNDGQEQLGEDPRILKARARATADLESLLRRNNTDLDYVEADWRDTRSLVEEAHGLILKHPGWSPHYISGDEFGIDANYVFFTSRTVDESIIHEAARLVIDEGAELSEPVVPKCPKCSGDLDYLIGSYPATVPAKAWIVDNRLLTDWVDGIKIGDTIDGGVGTWHCPCCDEQLFKAGEESRMEAFLKGEEMKNGDEHSQQDTL